MVDALLDRTLRVLTTQRPRLQREETRADIAAAVAEHRDAAGLQRRFDALEEAWTRRRSRAGAGVADAAAGAPRSPRPATLRRSRTTRLGHALLRSARAARARLSLGAHLRVAATVYASYKVPELVRWALRGNGRPPDGAARSARHRRNAQRIFDTALALRGLLIKMCQVIGTRSDIFPPEYVQVLSQCHDRLPPRAVRR